MSSSFACIPSPEVMKAVATKRGGEILLLGYSWYTEEHPGTHSLLLRFPQQFCGGRLTVCLLTIPRGALKWSVNIAFSQYLKRHQNDLWTLPSYLTRLKSRVHRPSYSFFSWFIWVFDKKSALESADSLVPFSPPFHWWHAGKPVGLNWIGG